MTEKEIENLILEYLTSLRNGFFWKVNTTGIWDEKRKAYRKPNSKYIIKGVADIIGIYKGVMIALEVKTPARKNNFTQDQFWFLKNIQEQGGEARIVTSLDDAMDFIKYLDEKLRVIYDF